jgi:hypothetical protein
MPYCNTCAAAYEFGSDRCRKCGTALPTIPGAAPVQRPVAMEAFAAAGRGRRLIAGLVDFIICVSLTFYLDRTVIPRLLVRSRFRGIALMFVLLALPAAYAVFRDAFGGKSIGKLFSGLTVVNRQARRRANARDSFLRNVSFGFLGVPLFGWIVFIGLSALAAAQIATGRGVRFGDGMAGTQTMADRAAEDLGI